MHELWKINKLFEGLAIKAVAQNVSFVLINNGVLKTRVLGNYSCGSNGAPHTYLLIAKGHF
jgi:hypothetical protein